MTMFRAAAAALTLTFASPLFAQSSGFNSGAAAPAGSSAVMVTRGSAPPQAFYPGDFPLLGASPWRPGRERFADVPHHPHPDHPHKWRQWYGYGIGIGGYIDPDRGYFAEGGTVEVVNNQALYDYDRGYPYDYYPEPAGWDERPRLAARESYCQMKWTRDRRTREEVPVRVCRN